MINLCIRHRCVQCCLETEMPLLNKDIEQIKRIGYEYDFFVVSKFGWLQLKNRDGKCVFNDDKQCLIYDERPEGCKSYPIIYDDDADCATLDEECPHIDEFKISKTDTVKLRALIRKLEDERKNRVS